ncbi:TetR family transcriptional regulator [Paenibacillus sp. UY79]|nr:TetR family transcriptional regulator [Paenibacillus farraposensis]
MEDKKERIVCAATEVFIQNGIEKTKISDIVKVAGIAQGTMIIASIRWMFFYSKVTSV